MTAHELWQIMSPQLQHQVVIAAACLLVAGDMISAAVVGWKDGLGGMLKCSGLVVIALAIGTAIGMYKASESNGDAG